MKPYGWLMLVAGLAAVLVLLFVSRAEYNDLEADLASLQDDLTGLQTVYDSTQAELADIKQRYPARNFASEQAEATTVEEMYAKGLAIQEAAAKDGYLISVDFEVPYSFYYFVYCVAIIDGEIWLWEVETDELFKAENWDSVK